jgi:acetoacetate decarboxylase
LFCPSLPLVPRPSDQLSSRHRRSIAGGRELWGISEKARHPTLRAAIDTLVGTLDYGAVRIATGTIGYKHAKADLSAVKASLLGPNFRLKIMPHVDGSPRICELVEYHLEDINLIGAWTGPAALTLCSRASPPCRTPGLRGCLRSSYHRRLTLGLGKVVHDYLAQ